MKKRFIETILALILILSSTSIVLAAPFDLTYNADNTKNYTFNQFIDSPAIFDFVAAHLAGYEIEGLDGTKYNAEQINNKTMMGMTFVEAVAALNATTAVAKLLFTFDDGYIDNLSVAAPILAEKGFKGTSYINKYAVIAGADNQMRLVDVKALYNDFNWDIGNHSASHKFLYDDSDPDGVNTTYLNTNDAIADYIINEEWLYSEGFARAADHVAYAYGERNLALINGLMDNGCKTGRKAWSGMQPMPVDNYFEIFAQGVGGGNLTEVKSEIDKAVASGATIMLMLHEVNNDDPGAYTISINDFQALVDYVAGYSLEGKIDVTTISEWYAGMPMHSTLLIEPSSF